MNTARLSNPASVAHAPWYARQVIRLLEDMGHGCLHLQLPNDMAITLGQGQPDAHLQVHQWSMFRDVLTQGDIGFAEAYIAGAWDTPDLAGLLTLLARNRDDLEQAIYGRWWGRLYNRLRHLRNANTRAGSRRNIATHYDLGNAFYGLWLDRSMTYSSACFDADPGASLEAAQARKYQRMLDLLGMDKGGSILEIGCGWGGFAEHAARVSGHRVRGITLSREQLDHARRRIEQAGLARQCSFAFQDYREEDGQYDGIVSIEMFEAVGEAYWPAYFDTLKKALKPGGRAAVQTILIDDALFDRYRQGSDFIQRYVFPGGMLPSPRRFVEEAKRAGFAVTRRDHFGLDYAETLARWCQTFLARKAEVKQLGFDERFVRIWHFYLAYCEAGFRAGSIDVAQFGLEHA
ncbi:MAG TPA: cyclopropane-fatty-acyl-phospholipid synthase family protein [Gammaproteobacteria bacterium]